MIIDAHQHFWRYDAGQYDWIDASMTRIRRDYTPGDVAPLLWARGVAGTIAVQARQVADETAWLLALAAEHPDQIKGVVGWAPLRERGVEIDAMLDSWGRGGALKGLRHVLQGEPDGYMADPNFNAAVARLAARNLSYDLLVRADQLQAAIRFVDRHPDLSIVLDHIGKPVVNGRPDPAWVGAIQELARRDNVWCKFSGVATEVPGTDWNAALVRPYFETVLAAFGAGRLMFGSDWPVCLLATEYLDWFDFVQAEVAALSPAEQADIMGETAARFYRIGHK